MPIEYFMIDGVKTPIEMSTASSEEDFYEPDGLSISEVFAERHEMIREGRIAFRPVEEFAEIDAKRLRSVLNSKPGAMRNDFPRKIVCID